MLWMYALDVSCDHNPAIDNSLRNAVQGDDPHLVVDLRHINKGRPGDTFDLLFNKLKKCLEEHAAADERMNNVEHTSNFLSVRDLIEGTPLLSESTVLFAFVPKNSYADSAKYTKEELIFNTRHTKQLRASLMDEHFCAALYRYMREYTIKFRDYCIFLSG